MSATEAATVVGVEAVDTGTGEIHRPTVLMTEDEARIITADIKAWAATDQLAAALGPDDVLDLYALYDHIGAVLATHQAKEQNA